MLVIEPSTWGLIVADCRDLRVATYSEESVTGCGFIASTFTRIAGGGPCGPCGFELHPHSAVVMPMIAISEITAPDVPKLEFSLGIVELITGSRPKPFEQTHHLGRCHRFSNVFLPVKSVGACVRLDGEHHGIGSEWEHIMLTAGRNRCRALVFKARMGNFHNFLFGTVDLGPPRALIQ